MTSSRLEVYHNATSQARFICHGQDPWHRLARGAYHNYRKPWRLWARTRSGISWTPRSGRNLPLPLGPDGNAAANSTVTENCPGTVSALTVPLVILCAGIASINPCGLAVLAILLLSIIALQTRRQVLMVGITYIAAVFLFYFISGLGFLSFIDVSGLGISSLIATAAAAIAIVLGR